VVGRKTGRTVQQWITERRMTEARRLLAGTDLTVQAVGARVGYRDASYFIRSFRRGHGVTPLEWRHAGTAWRCDAGPGRRASLAAMDQRALGRRFSGVTLLRVDVALPVFAAAALVALAGAAAWLRTPRS
jgi:AraC-like DNA-binding protein